MARSGAKVNDRETTGRLGVNAVERIFLEMGWFFREQPICDWGIDAHAEEKKDDTPTGNLIALQIKSGKSYFRKRGDSYVFYGAKRHLDYWENHRLPVYLILFNPETGETLWQKIERRFVTETADGNWSISVPATNTLSKESARYLAEGIASDPEAVRRRRLVLDLSLIAELADQKEAYLRVDDWINKTLNFRGSELRYEDLDKEEADYYFNTWLPGRSIADFMELFFPWLDYEYVEEIEEFQNEVALHKLEVRLNDLGRAFLLTEKYFKNGPDHRPAPEPPGSEYGGMSEEEWQDALWHNAIDGDDK